MNKPILAEQIIKSKQRESNLDLFRIVVMLLIVAHHYVVNSEVSHLMVSGDIDAHSVFFNIFGAIKRKTIIVNPSLHISHRRRVNQH